ncbi:MAG: hypothetical protein JRI47_08455, partial [Deltaproteobacteria bacterium]|nr:hypothetical protein [Deltaproteobacteria bacterium]
VIRTFSFDGRALGATASDETDARDDNPEEDIQIESRIEAFCTNVRNTLHAFSSQVHEASPQQVFLTGSGSLHPDVDN